MINFGKQIIVVIISLLVAGTLSAMQRHVVPWSRLPASPHTPLVQLAGGNVLVLAGHSPVYRLQIVERFPLVQQRRNGPMTDLHKAVMRGEQDTVIALVQGRADIDAPGDYGWSPLHFAIEFRNIGMIMSLLHLGADFELYDIWGQRPLHKAAAIGFEDAVNALLQKGAQRNVRTIAGSTPLDFARQNGHQKIVDLLEKSV